MDQHDTFDVIIIGGGINGCGIARDLVGRGYSVLLAEKVDFASGTSSWSTKLIHGGLRYLEHYEFRLVREALIEREVLWAMAPHIIRPLRFVLPHHEGLRPTWMLRLGLFAYDHLGGRKLLPATRTLDLRSDEAGAPLKDEFVKGFEYSDCWVDDARFVVLNARDAADRGATIKTRTEVTEARPDGEGWCVTLRGADGALETVRGRCLVNAAGPWVDHVLGETFGRNDAHNVRLVQGSHIVVRKLYDHDKAYIFQNGDGRIIFAIPYEGEFTLIGTTDSDFTGDPRAATIKDAEIDYLVAAASEYFKTPVTRDALVWTYSGVRPLFDDGASKAQEATRDYVLRTEGGHGKPALLNVFGGKLTTYRRLAESAAERIAGLIGGKGGNWTAKAPLPGGDMPISVAQGFARRLTDTYPWLDAALAARLARLYGVRAQDILRGATGADDLGRRFGAGLTEREVRHLIDTEWAITAEDVLWRRTKLGLFMTDDERAGLDEFMKDATGHAAHAA
ncbi:glycerol-3-phosphate dehydrogenase [Acuticoccus sp. I52.16.1]|uniref:glycerol-3-phosphate dehydrogenase n=1 Tax=Acuticoccus sp. I52.16.1 TaxID=2928472 RepID=UPI001FD447E8|nr:glycerol-3-phosphate dehydrogenase [Acuticoccus sp. I52.16.1]UOM34688.1 glycerol-3-phosphate dehydrogenase [Acuticoccus sp. I52.16.1]